jgi:hypothetical protein
MTIAYQFPPQFCRAYALRHCDRQPTCHKMKALYLSHVICNTVVSESWKRPYEKAPGLTAVFRRTAQQSL